MINNILASINFQTNRFMKYFLIALLLISACKTPIVPAIPAVKEVIIESDEGHIHGSLLLPADTSKPFPIVIIIAGSGPTDRNCNQAGMKSDAFKMLADSLAKSGIASYRYDKRGVGASNNYKMSEAELRFDDFVTDAVAVINHFNTDKRFSKIIVAGHSEGALLGLLACKQTTVTAYISMCGAGRTIGVVMKEQLAKQPDAIKNECNRIIDSLINGVVVKNVTPMLATMFRESVQPYLISWMKYDPAKEFAELKIPSLVIEGDSDVQVSVLDAETLKNANPNTQYKIVAGMNHVLKSGFKNRDENLASYNKPEVPISSDFVKTVTDFILGLK